MDTHMPALRHLMDAHRIERAHIAQVEQLQRIDRVMKTMARLAAHGFVPIGFTCAPLASITLHVEAPNDLMVDAVRGSGAMGGRFSSEENQRWFIYGGVRVLWDAPAKEAS